MVAALALAGGVVAATGLPAPRPDAPKGRSFVRPDRRLALLGAVAFCVLLAEGSVTDWSAVYLNEGAGASEGLAAAGLAVFSLTMALGRLAGDRVAERWSAPAVIRAGTLLAAAGLGLGLAVAEPAAGIAGYALMGVGLSACFPLVVAASAHGSRRRRGGVDRAGVRRRLRGADRGAGDDRPALGCRRPAPGAAPGGGAGGGGLGPWPAPRGA